MESKKNQKIRSNIDLLTKLGYFVVESRGVDGENVSIYLGQSIKISIPDRLMHDTHYIMSIIINTEKRESYYTGQKELQQKFRELLGINIVKSNILPNNRS